MPKPDLNPPPYHVADVNFDEWKRWFDRVFVRFNENGPFPIYGFAVADLPNANNHAQLTGNPYSSIVFVTDSVDGPTIAFSNGTDWISLITGVVV